MKIFVSIIIPFLLCTSSCCHSCIFSKSQKNNKEENVGYKYRYPKEDLAGKK